ncbi:Clavaminate synthase-like protein [Cylindrobasidium torrendii FP15055 ss-10]|uniref:Clavaminate synthase-like protein n=1 Tax=Cylindrobasidium torrendii FP15055 ss-10 TaxID=1314674 RepID=A0A0D7B355_9AGAR|nr:Clavaminate synthase-like protein [Cylindrobasidium torrendii FP15055 ss-10]
MSLVAAARSSDTAFSEIPIIDMSLIYTDDSKARLRLAQEVRDACVNVGFFYVKNHGIPAQLVENFLNESKAFFAQPEATKMQIENKKSPAFKGYHPALSSNNDPNNEGDLHEGFEFGYEPMDTQRNTEGLQNGAMAGANVWPSGFPAFREAALAYYHASIQFGKALFPLFALALELPPDFFEDKTRNSAALMKMLHYPPQTGTVDDRVIGIGAHTDWECFTMLWQQPGIQALQVLNPDGKWIDAPALPGTLVINLGDQLARWTNGIFKSTVHRAVNRSGVERYSSPLFFGTDYDVRLEPISSCVSVERPMQYDVVTAGEYVKSKFQQTYG